MSAFSRHTLAIFLGAMPLDPKGASPLKPPNLKVPRNFRILKLAVAAVKIRFQDCGAIFYAHSATLAVGRRSGSVRRSSATVFQGVSRRKTSRSFCVSRWAAQAVSVKNRPQAEPANRPAGKNPAKSPTKPLAFFNRHERLIFWPCVLATWAN